MAIVVSRACELPLRRSDGIFCTTLGGQGPGISCRQMSEREASTHGIQPLTPLTPSGLAPIEGNRPESDDPHLAVSTLALCVPAAPPRPPPRPSPPFPSGCLRASIPFPSVCPRSIAQKLSRRPCPPLSQPGQAAPAPAAGACPQQHLFFSHLFVFDIPSTPSTPLFAGEKSIRIAHTGVTSLSPPPPL